MHSTLQGGPGSDRAPARIGRLGAGAHAVAPLLAAGLLAAGLAAPTSAAAQTDGSPPLRWDEGPVLELTDPEAPAAVRAAEGALVLASFVAFDRSLRDASLSVNSGTTEDLAAAAEWFGDWQASLPFIAGGAAAVGAVTEGPKGLGQAAAVLGGIFSGSMVNEGLNLSVGRSRPLEERGAFDFRPFTGHASFPSGHTAFVFSAAAGIDAVTEGWAPAAAAYGVATLTGISRIYHDKHWLTDVAVGAAVGTFVSYRATRQVARWLGAGQGSARPAGRGASGPRERGDGSRASPAASGSGGPKLRLLATPTLVGLQIRL